MSEVQIHQSLRQRVVNVAAREENETNAAKYWAEVLDPRWKGPFPPHWCGAFALWCLRRALGCSIIWDVQGCYGAKASGFLHHLPRTEEPELGDICYMDRPYQHHAILTAIGTAPDGVGYVISQDGNSGPTPGICQEQWRKRSQWTAFYSITPLLVACPAKYVDTYNNGER